MIVFDGVVIGHGAIIAAGAIVTKHVGYFDIVAGNPAKKIGQRFENDVCQKIKDSLWWEYQAYSGDELISMNMDDAIVQLKERKLEERFFIELVKGKVVSERS